MLKTRTELKLSPPPFKHWSPHCLIFSMGEGQAKHSRTHCLQGLYKNLLGTISGFTKASGAEGHQAALPVLLLLRNAKISRELRSICPTCQPLHTEGAFPLSCWVFLTFLSLSSRQFAQHEMRIFLFVNILPIVPFGANAPNWNPQE